MIFGDGAPHVWLYYGDGEDILKEFTLPHPVSRAESLFVEEFDIEENVLGELVPINKFYRYKEVMSFVNLTNLNADYLSQIANWQERVFIKPFGSGTAIGEFVQVTRFTIGSHQGNVNYTDAEIEFTGISRRKTIPRLPEYIYTIHSSNKSIKQAII